MLKKIPLGVIALLLVFPTTNPAQAEKFAALAIESTRGIGRLERLPKYGHATGQSKLAVQRAAVRNCRKALRRVRGPKGVCSFVVFVPRGQCRRPKAFGKRFYGKSVCNK